MISTRKLFAESIKSLSKPPQWLTTITLIACILFVIITLGKLTGVIGVHTIVTVQTMQGSEGAYYDFQSELWFDTVDKSVYIGNEAVSTVKMSMCVNAQSDFKIFEVQKPFRYLPKNFAIFQKSWIGVVQPGTSVCFSGYYQPKGYLLKGMNKGP